MKWVEDPTKLSKEGKRSREKRKRDARAERQRMKEALRDPQALIKQRQAQWAALPKSSPPEFKPSDAWVRKMIVRAFAPPGMFATYDERCRRMYRGGKPRNKKNGPK